MKITFLCASIFSIALCASCASTTTVPYIRDINGNNSNNQPILTNEKQAFCMDRVPDSTSQYIRTTEFNKCMRNVDDLMRKQRESLEEWERNAPIRAQQAQQEQLRLKQEREQYERQKEEENQAEIQKYNKMFNF